MDTGHVPGKQEKTPEGEEREKAEQTPLLTGPRAMQSRGVADTAGYSAGRQKHASCRRLGNEAGVVKK